VGVAGGPPPPPPPPHPPPKPQPHNILIINLIKIFKSKLIYKNQNLFLI
jgi:hypothetical protein